MLGLSHRAHGLLVTEESDVELAWEPAAEAAGGPAAERVIRVPAVATFRVSGGCRVTIDRFVGADPVEVEASLAGRVTAALLQVTGTPRERRLIQASLTREVLRMPGLRLPVLGCPLGCHVPSAMTHRRRPAGSAGAADGGAPRARQSPGRSGRVAERLRRPSGHGKQFGG